MSFGVVARNITSARANVNVVNCGDLPLTLSRFELSNPGATTEPADGMVAKTLSYSLSRPFYSDLVRIRRPESERAEATLTIVGDSTIPIITIVDRLGGSPHVVC